ncbi:MAG TPA: hypothetical protein VMZ27_18515 [Candidatus Saccharimonadales bacterium]|nr:hypothetical protein [Candidatus Saccharimonadales bacterium]
MFSRTSRRAIFLAGLPLVCVLLYLFFTQPPDEVTAPKLVSVQFLGYTNTGAGPASPQFSISNMTTFSLQCSAIGAMSQVTNIVRRGGTNVAWGWRTGWVQKTFQPEEKSTFTISTPPQGVPWRFGVFAIKPLNAWQKAVEKFGSRLPPRLCRLLRGSDRTTEYIQSGLFTNAPAH